MKDGICLSERLLIYFCQVKLTLSLLILLLCYPPAWRVAQDAWHYLEVLYYWHSPMQRWVDGQQLIYSRHDERMLLSFALATFATIFMWWVSDILVAMLWRTTNSALDPE